MAKQLLFSDEGRRKILSGIEQLAAAVKVTLGPKGRNVVLDKKFGSPVITNDGVTIAKEIELEDHYDDTNTPPATIILRHTATLTGTGLGGGSSMNVHSHYFIYDVWAEVTQKLDFANEPDASYKALNDIKILYSASEGFSKGYAGGSGLADDVHEVHRDLMYRFAGVDYADAHMKDWTGGGGATVAGQRAGWGVRLWLLEPTSLKDILEQLQYEGCFIFKLVADSDGSGNPGGKYILLENTYDSGDITYTLTNADYDSLNISITPFSELVTKTTYNYNRHPADNHYIDSETITNSTARSNYNIATDENASVVNLDFLIDCNNSPDTVYDSVNDDLPNESIACYYDNIQGSPKVLVSTTIVNPAKFDLEVGDKVQFSDADVLPFGMTWANAYFMIVETRRTTQSLYITCREVYYG